jgi:ABC-type branched-subunit amino acid transport system ATPase component
VIMIVTFGEPWNAVVAAGGLALIPAYITASSTSTYLQVLFGVAAVTTALGLQGKMPMKMRMALERFGKRRARPAHEPARSSVTDGAVDAEPAIAVHTVTPFALRIEDLTVRFGGLVAVDSLSLEALPHRITGLIGPNGAGKSTVFNACSGLVRTSGGRLYFDSTEVTREGASARARHGLGRTFQQIELFDNLSVAENVSMGREASIAGAGVVSHLIALPRERETIDHSVADALALCRLDTLAGEQAGSLSTGQRRLVELARCLAGPFGFLLLDEPSSGLDRTETLQFAEILEEVVAEREIGVLLVEHDMSLVMQVCQQIFVMDFGTMIFSGSPEEVRNSDLVRAAYLGTEFADLEQGDLESSGSL